MVDTFLYLCILCGVYIILMVCAYIDLCYVLIFQHSYIFLFFVEIVSMDEPDSNFAFQVYNRLLLFDRQKHAMRDER